VIRKLSEIVEATQGSAVPKWLHDAVIERRLEIACALQVTGEYVLAGPNGERVTIRATEPYQP
jgi:hypothetical protein